MTWKLHAHSKAMDEVLGNSEDEDRSGLGNSVQKSQVMTAPSEQPYPLTRQSQGQPFWIGVLFCDHS